MNIAHDPGSLFLSLAMFSHMQIGFVLITRFPSWAYTSAIWQQVNSLNLRIEESLKILKYASDDRRMRCKNIDD